MVTDLRVWFRVELFVAFWEILFIGNLIKFKMLKEIELHTNGYFFVIWDSTTLFTHCQIPLPPLVCTMFYSPKCIYLAKQCSTADFAYFNVQQHINFVKLCYNIVPNGASHTLSLIDSTELNEDFVVLIYTYGKNVLPYLNSALIICYLISGVFSPFVSPVCIRQEL